MTGSSNSSSCVSNTSLEVINSLKALNDVITTNFSIHKFPQDIISIVIQDEDGEQYSNIDVQEVYMIYDPLMKTAKIVVKSTG
jgi:hypothetical protein